MVDQNRSHQTLWSGYSSEPPLLGWQVSAGEVVRRAEENLWSPDGEGALAYLVGRGLTTTTIHQARLGYVPGDYRERKTIAGLEVPSGITLPWLAASALWAIKVRRAYGTPTYLQMPGSSANGLYGADALSSAKPVLFCEGELDTLLAQQEAGKLVTAVTLGSPINLLSPRWLPYLESIPVVFVAYDCDDAGVRGAKRLVKTCPHFRTITLPFGKDITEFHLHGGDVYGWIEEQLR